MAGGVPQSVAAQIGKPFAARSLNNWHEAAQRYFFSAEAIFFSTFPQSSICDPMYGFATSFDV